MKRTNRKDVLVFVNIIAPYNIPLFNRIAQSFDKKVLFLFDQAKEANRSWRISDNDIRFDYYIEDSLHFKRLSRAANGTALHGTIYVPFFIFKRIWSYKPSVVFSIEFGLRTMFCLIMCKLTGAKLYVISDVTPVTEAQIGFLKKFVRKAIAKYLTGAVARSYTAKKYLESLGIAKEKIVVSPYAIELNSQAIDLEHVNKNCRLEAIIKEKIKNKFCFLYSGHIVHAKGIDLLINAVAKLPKNVQDKVIVLLAGGTEFDLNSLNTNYNKDIFLPVGFIPNNQILSVYPIANCFILPTRSDTWALVVNEAVVTGCPVMVSKYAGSAGELIEDGYSGIVFDPLNEKEFIDKLIFCVEKRELLSVYATNAKTKLREYNNNVSAQRIVDLIESIIKN